MMAGIRSENVDIETLRELIRYDAVTGSLTWLARQPKHFTEGRHSAEHTAAKWNGQYAGQPALTAIEASGYRHGDIFATRYKAHRVAWALHHGYWPTSDIDHINGDPSDNRIENLRCVSKTENMRNQKLSTANKSGVIGVCWNPRSHKWSAQIKVLGRKRHIGLFERIEDAAGARKAAEQRYGFHPNHGRAAA